MLRAGALTKDGGAGALTALPSLLRATESPAWQRLFTARGRPQPRAVVPAPPSPTRSSFLGEDWHGDQIEHTAGHVLAAAPGLYVRHPHPAGGARGRIQQQQELEEEVLLEGEPGGETPGLMSSVTSHPSTRLEGNTGEETPPPPGEGYHREGPPKGCGVTP